MPNRNKVINLGLERSVNIRQMIVDNYSIIYNIKDDVVTVLRVLYNASDITNKFNKIYSR